MFNSIIVHVWQLAIVVILFVEYLPEKAENAETCTRFNTCLYIIISNYSSVVGVCVCVCVCVTDFSHMRGKVSSDWLPSYIKAALPVLEIFKMAGYFPDRPRVYMGISLLPRYKNEYFPPVVFFCR